MTYTCTTTECSVFWGFGDVMQWAAILPLLVVVIQSARGKLPTPEARILAVAFFISFLADSYGGLLQDQAEPNLWLSYLFVPAQYALFVSVMVPVSYKRVIWFGFLLVVLASLLRNTFGATETFVQVMAGFWVALVAYRHVSEYRLSVMLYCIGVVPGVLVMGIATPVAGVYHGAWVNGWYAFQAMRLIALLWMSYLLVGVRHGRLRIVDRTGWQEPTIDWAVDTRIARGAASVSRTIQEHVG